MGSFTFISIAALFCYTFLFLTLLAAEKNRSINAYLMILGSMMLWTGGSLLMRVQFFSVVEPWYDVSILGLMLFVYGYFVFAYEYVGARQKGLLIFWGILIAGIWSINMVTGLFLAAPSPMPLTNGAVTFVYHFTWKAAILFLVLFVILSHVAVLLLRHLRKNELSRRQFVPIAVGIVFLIVGHMMFFLPIFSGIPTDIISGVLNAICMFYGLYRRQLFRLTLLVSRGSCYVLSGAASIGIFTQFIQPVSRFFRDGISIPESYHLLAISIVFTLATLCLYRLLQFFLDNVFVREEIAQAEQLKEFSVAISRSLNMKEILGCIVEIVQNIVRPNKMFIFIADSVSQTYRMEGNSAPLDNANLTLGQDHPIVEWFRGHNDCLLLSDFRRTTLYKSIWRQEKQMLEALEIECMAPLKDGGTLVGIMMLSKKRGNKAYSNNDISILDSINSISSIAVTNSRLYSCAYIEARTDDMTKLYNRKYFYELLDEEFKNTKGSSLALCMISIDDLKLYNQLYGYKEGDQMIEKIAKIISGCVGESGHVARHSGKVFAIILPRYDLRSAKLLAENIRSQAASMHQTHKDYALRTMTVSGGVAAIPYSATTPKNLVEHADLAMFHVKRNGKNAILAYTNGDYTIEKTRAAFRERRTAYNEYENTIYALMAAIDAKDHYTFNHSMNVMYYATKLAEALNMNADYVEIIREAAVLHDIGKIGVPEHILNKTGNLMKEEFEIMKGHVEQSITMIKFLPSLDYVIPSVIAHHERYDGLGYPRGLKGEDIPLGARILCIADSFDAMMSSRSYKLAYPLERTMAIMEEEAGRQFDPHMVSVFVGLVRSGKIMVKSLAGRDGGVSVI